MGKTLHTYVSDDEFERLARLATELGSHERKGRGAVGKLPIAALLRDMAAITDLVLSDHPGIVRRVLATNDNGTGD